MKKQHIKAFTLAEVLITLVIIGIIAALTIPNLMQKYTEQTTVKRVQKFYSTLSNAYSLAKKENGPIGEWGATYGYYSESATKIYKILFKPYFKITKNCGTAKGGNCMAIGKYKYLNNGLSDDFRNDPVYYKITLDDGSAVCWSGVNSIFYDANGPKSPNQWGKDIFNFEINEEGVYPSGTPKLWQGAFKKYCNTSNTGVYGCAAWIIFKGNMDYLHCDGLDWTGKDKCK